MNSKYSLNNELISFLNNDPEFIKKGFYLGRDSGIYFSVIDPRIHSVNVWVKSNYSFKKKIWKKLSNKIYQDTATSLDSYVFTNGPFMLPLGNIKNKWMIRIAYLCPGWGMKPVGVLVHNGVILNHDSVNSPWFGRTGTGSFDNYMIQDTVPNGAVEGIVGHLIIRNKKIINPTQTSWAAKASAICCWGLIPHKMPEVGKTSKFSTNDEQSGIILVAGSNTQTYSIPQKMLDVGVTDAIGVDGGTSALMGEGKNMFFKCKWYKDKIQRYGLFCTKN